MDEYVKMLYRVGTTLIFFIMLTAAFYFGFNWIDHYQENFHRYDEPGAGAVRVFRSEQNDSAESPGAGVFDLRPRLMEFLRNGE